MQQDITCYITFWLLSLESLRNSYNLCRQGSAIICILQSGNSVQKGQPDYMEAKQQLKCTSSLSSQLGKSGCTKVEATCVLGWGWHRLKDAGIKFEIQGPENPSVILGRQRNNFLKDRIFSGLKNDDLTWHPLQPLGILLLASLGED